LTNYSFFTTYTMKAKTMEYIDMVTMIVVAILVIDFVGFVAWVMSGQVPPDGFFVGAITKNVINLFI